jgi:hypothetical protein
MAGELGVEPSRVQAAVGSIAPAGAQVGVLPLLIREEIAIAVVGLPKGEFLGIAPLPPAN